MTSQLSEAAADLAAPKLKLEVASGDPLTAHEFTVHERLSAPFEINLVARSPRADIDLEEIVGKKAAFGYRAMDLEVVAWTGICSYMEMAQVETSETGLSTYRLTIVPALWLMTQRRGNRIFQHMSFPDIVKKILTEEYKIEARWDLSDTYPKHEYEVQFGETDFAFVSRLLEEAGISYYFEKVVSGGGSAAASVTAESKLVFIDKPEKAPSLGEIRFFDQPNNVRTQRFVTHVHIAHDVKPGKFTLRDYDLRRPDLALEEESALSGTGKEEKYERYRYWPGVSLIEVSGGGDTPVADEHGVARHKNDEEKAHAQRAAEAERNGKRYVEFDSNEKDLAPGVVFTIGEHPHDELDGQKLLVAETIISGTFRDWRLVGVALFVDDSLRVRPVLRTPRPRVMGYQTAIVVGPPGKEIHSDELGRVRVRFHWDREGKFDDNATCWLRVSQQWAGAGFGWMLVPRVGQEVLVDFFEGDPSQPVIVGRLHNLTTTVPRVLPKHMTQSTWKSATTPFTDGWFNEIMMDDDAGKEIVFIQAQRDLFKLVKRNETERTGEEKNVIVGAARVDAVAKKDMVQIGKQHLVQVVKAGDLHIPDMGNPEYSAKPTFFEVVDGRITLTTGKSRVVLDGSDIGIETDGGVRFSSDGQLIMKGSTIYLNEKRASVTKVKADKKLIDPVKKPDRMLKPIEDNFWKKMLAKMRDAAKAVLHLPGGVLPDGPESPDAPTAPVAPGAAPGAPGGKPPAPLPPPPSPPPYWERPPSNKKTPPATPTPDQLALAASQNEPETTAAAVTRNASRRAARRVVAHWFYANHGSTWDKKNKKRRMYDPTSPGDYRAILGHQKGIDFNQPLTVGVSPPPPPPSIAQWQKKGGNQGNYYAGKTTAPTELGIGDLADDSTSPTGVSEKIARPYDVKNGTPYLKTKAAAINDTWSAGEAGVVQPSTGGGDQWYIGDNTGMTDKKGLPDIKISAAMKKKTLATKPKSP
jgi:type VI secretion system secreted protein VgrG